jgi:hypothetical protein
MRQSSTPPASTGLIVSEPIIPAFLIGDGRQIGFRCPRCCEVHMADYDAGNYVPRRSSHCLSPSPGSLIMIVGWRRSSDDVPQLSFEDVRNLNLGFTPSELPEEALQAMLLLAGETEKSPRNKK